MLGRRILCWLDLDFMLFASLFSSSICAVDQMIWPNRISSRWKGVQKNNSFATEGPEAWSGSTNRSPGFEFVKEVLWFDSFVWHQVCRCHHRASLGTWWRPSAAARCCLKFWKNYMHRDSRRSARKYPVTKKWGFWSLVLMSLPLITVSTSYLFLNIRSLSSIPFLLDLDHLQRLTWSTWPRQTADGLVKHFGSLVTSMNTLFRAISGGVTWEVPAEFLLQVGAEWVMVFTFYIAFCCY